MDEHRRQLLAQCASLRRAAVLGITISVVAAVLCALTVPFVYNYLQRVQTMFENEADYCRTRTTTMWKQVARTALHSGLQKVPAEEDVKGEKEDGEIARRVRRQEGSYQPPPASSTQSPSTYGGGGSPGGTSGVGGGSTTDPTVTKGSTSTGQCKL